MEWGKVMLLYPGYLGVEAFETFVTLIKKRSKRGG